MVMLIVDLMKLLLFKAINNGFVLSMRVQLFVSLRVL